MVFQFEHVGLDHGAAASGTSFPLDLRDLKASFGRWQAGLADVGWNSLYWNNHDQPRIVSRLGDDGEHRVRSAKLLGTVLHLHRGTPYVYQGEELGMTNVRFAAIDDFRDIESLNHYAQAIARGDGPRRRRRRHAADEPRQRAHADAVGRVASTPASPPATPWIAGQPEPRRDQRRGRGRRPGLGLPPLPAADRAAPQRAGGRARRLHDAAAPTTSACTRSRAGSTTSSCSCSRTSPARTRAPTSTRHGLEAELRARATCPTRRTSPCVLGRPGSIGIGSAR